MNYDDYKAAYIGRVGADRMALGLPCVPNKDRGDLDKVKELVEQRDRLADALRQYLTANVPRPLGGIIDEQEREQAAVALQFERADAREHARSVLASIKAPVCDLCNSSRNMVHHPDGWTCHSTHPID